MTRGAVAIAGAALAIAACNGTDEPPTSNTDQPAKAAADEAPPATPAPANTPQARTPVAEPKGPIDPKSAEAAGQVVQSYGALIEQKRWMEANALWGDRSTAGKFQSELSQYSDVHLEIGNPGDLGGAAGSIYVTVPAFFYGELKHGKPFRRSADIILRRVNDVPGSSEEQRRWHIERIDWKTAN
jgi:hypothetical protein